MELKEAKAGMNSEKAMHEAAKATVATLTEKLDTVRPNSCLCPPPSCCGAEECVEAIQDGD